MAILGTLIDKKTISRAGDALSGVTFATSAHSLPATNPETLLPVVRSIEEMAQWGTNGLPKVLAIGGNSSLATYGVIQASCVSCPALMFDLYAIVWHSVVR